MAGLRGTRWISSARNRDYKSRLPPEVCFNRFWNVFIGDGTLGYSRTLRATETETRFFGMCCTVLVGAGLESRAICWGGGIGVNFDLRGTRFLGVVVR